MADRSLTDGLSMDKSQLLPTVTLALHGNKGWNKAGNDETSAVRHHSERASMTDQAVRQLAASIKAPRMKNLGERERLCAVGNTLHAGKKG